MAECCTHSIIIEGLSVKIGDKLILDDVNAAINCGETTAVIGPNGAGKTTLLAALMGLVPYKGTVRFCHAVEHGGGEPVIGYVPQRMDFDRGIPVTVLDYLCLSHQKRPLWMGKKKDVIERSLKSLERVAAEHLADSMLGRLSGGEFQRVMLALALMDNPDILLMDEPVSGIDLAGGELFCDLIDELHREKEFTLLLVSHDLSVVTSHADSVLCLDKTVKCQGKTVEVLTEENLAEIYGLHKGLYRHDKCSHHGERA